MRSLHTALAIAVVAAASPFHGASAATIDFNTLPGAYFSAFTSYTENGFTVAVASGKFYVNDATTNPILGNPAPDIFQDDEHSGQRAESLILTKVGGGSFTFDSLDLNAFNGYPTYDIVGKLGGTQVYDYAGLITFNQGGPTGIVDLNPGEMSQLVSSVTLSFTQPDDPLDEESTSFDNFIFNTQATVSPVPEPSSLFLLGSFMLCLGGVVRRRLTCKAADGQTV